MSASRVGSPSGGGSEEATPPPRSVVVIGLGLMGGSLCRALKGLAAPPRVVGMDPDPDQRRLAEEAGAVDASFGSPSDGAPGHADVVVYATPLRVALSLIGEHGGLWSEAALVTDLVGLKAPIMAAAASSGLSDRFVGAHPLCGGEGSGFGVSRPDLYREATVWLCAGRAAPEALRARAARFWESVGGRVRWVEPDEHDRTMAWVSHLPQLTANALAGALDAAGFPPSVLGPGGKDMTRLAGSNPEVWKDLLQSSAPVTGTGLTSVSRALNVLADLLARREVDKIAEFMDRTRRWRESGDGSGGANAGGGEGGSAEREVGGGEETR